jgi:hypothetical protein
MRDNGMIAGQATLFDTAEPVNTPRYSQGDAIYKVVLDVIEGYTIDSSWPYRTDVFGEHLQSGQTLWRYHVDSMGSGGHDVFGEYEMGQVWFDDSAKAECQARLNRSVIEAAHDVIRAGQLEMTEKVAVSVLDGERCLFGQVARVGERSVLEKQMYCYPFLRTFQTAKEAKRHYNKVKAGFECEGTWPVDFEHYDLYRVKDGLWSSYEYAERHGDWGFLYDGQAPGKGKPHPEHPTPKRKRDKEYER